MYQTDDYEGMIAETITIPGANGDMITAYYARPLGPGPFPGMVAIHHMPGWDEWYREATRKLAHHGYATISPNLYHRAGHGTPEDVAAKVRADGGLADEQVLGDLAGCLKFLQAPVPAGVTHIWRRAALPASRRWSTVGAGGW